ncbi:hypothetical protein Scep_010465 [Stephania cephalantha]|uniref:Uncharacterized protein n=1 Tax=Stephania cephalantha TaxID=152367 RepID=A0AAP0PF90_9MAGN
MIWHRRPFLSVPRISNYAILKYHLVDEPALNIPIVSAPIAAEDKKRQAKSFEDSK